MQAYQQKEWQLSYDLASEAIRLNPAKVMCGAIRLQGKPRHTCVCASCVCFCWHAPHRPIVRGSSASVPSRQVAYLGNRAAAALKLSGLQHLRQCVVDSKLACHLDPSYVKGYVR